MPAPMQTITADKDLVAYCGLYCGACRSYLSGRCPGCRKNEKATWCKVRTCCVTNEYAGCAACTIQTDPMQCASYNNFFSRLFGRIFHSDRAACVARIRAVGPEAFAREMAEQRRHTLPP
jgi:hypothetical protein